MTGLTITVPLSMLNRIIVRLADGRLITATAVGSDGSAVMYEQVDATEKPAKRKPRGKKR